ncbi:MAG: hypothetical protein RL173_1455 [Fibrobacterota bacterium]|jgi:hypothetical protein
MRKDKFRLVALVTVIAVQAGFAAPQDTVKWLMRDFRRPTANRAELERFHAVTVYDNHETICPEVTVKVSTIGQDSGGYASIQVTKSTGNVDSWKDSNRNKVTSCAGLLVPIDPWWRTKNDLRELKELRFKSRGRMDVDVSMDGPALPSSEQGYSPVANVHRWNGRWGWNVVDLPMDAFYHYWIDGGVNGDSPLVRGRYLDGRAKGDSAYDDDSVNILKNVRALKFELPNENVSFQIDSIMLVGVAPTWPGIEGKSCQGSSALLDDFSATKADPIRNLLGGAWWAASDTDTFRPQSPATGKSSVHTKGNVWSPSPESGAASLVADLDRVDADAHPDAGWASLFTSVPAGAMEKLKAISMKFRTGGDDPFPFDTSRIMGVVFRAIGPNFVDSLVYEAHIPYRQIKSTPEDSSICLDLSELRQPAWYTGFHGIKPVSPKDILRFSWSLVLQDPSATTASTSRIDLKEVRLWGMEPTSSIGSVERVRQEVGIRHLDGIRLSYSVPGNRAQVRIVGMDGAIASSFAAPATVSDMPLSHKLARGTYAIEILGSGERRRAKFTVP